jgi:dUTP pyrophosphatase
MMSLDRVEIKLMNPLLLELRAQKGLPGLISPATPASAGYDVIACIEEPVTIQPGEDFMFRLGFSLHIADPNYEAQIRSRSGLGAKVGLVVAQGTGTMDADYQGEWVACMFNRRPNNTPIKVKPGDAIAQVVFNRVEHPTFNEVEEFSQSSVRGAGGFGSTGR